MMKANRNLSHESKTPSAQQCRTVASPPVTLRSGRGGGLSAESQLCFGAAAGCFVLGVIGYGINALATTETTLSAFLVIGAFYALLGIISLFKTQMNEAVDGANDKQAEEQIESAA